MKVLLITPPLIQLNTPYPATQSLTAYLCQQGIDAVQWDMSIELIERIYTREFLAPLFEEAFLRDRLSERAKSVAMQKSSYLTCVESVVRFLQGKDDTLAVRIASREFLPEAGRFRKIDEDALEWGFGIVGVQDRAKHIASLFMVDLADFVAEMVSDKFALIKYAEKIAVSAPTFDKLHRELEDAILNKIDAIMLELIDQKISEIDPDLVGFTVPFPGSLYSALKCGKHIKSTHRAKIALGGGYISTELRSVSDTRVFDYTDYLLFDDGELPLYRLTEVISEKCGTDRLIRTLYRENNAIKGCAESNENIPFSQLPAPTYKGIDFSKYISLIEFVNPMHKLWSDGKWLKLTFAHGCYWGKCTFCDTKLDYISRFESADADKIIERVETIIKETGLTGIHFTDEALPPKLLFEFAEKIIEKGLIISFWGNIRFDKSFSKEKCATLAKAGCIAVSGGLEVASPRVLKLINKGVSIESATETAFNLTEAGIMVHAYLMYGFPTQTMQECIDSAEVVRQLFEAGVIQSGFWHRYAMTIHSPTGCNAHDYGVEIINNTPNPFANNAVEYAEDSDIDYKQVGRALEASIYNYMQGVGYDIPLKNWFESKEAVPTMNKRYIAKIIDNINR